MAEGGGDDALAAGADHRPGGRVLDAGFDGMALDPLQGATGGDDALVVADEGQQGDRLGGGQGEVAAGAVDDVALAVALVVGDAVGGGEDLADGGDHALRRRPPTL